MSSNLLIDPTIVESFKNGNIESFELIYKFYYKKIFRFCLKNVSSKTVAEDIVQDIFISIYLSINKLKDIAAFEKWIFRIAHYKIQDYHRKYYHDKNVPLNEDLASLVEDEKNISPQQVTEYHELRHFLETQFKEMNQKDANIGILRYLDNFSIKEIAKILQIPIGTVKSRGNKVKNLLIKQLKNYSFE